MSQRTTRTLMFISFVLLLLLLFYTSTDQSPHEPPNVLPVIFACFISLAALLLARTENRILGLFFTGFLSVFFFVRILTNATSSSDLGTLVAGFANLAAFIIILVIRKR